MYPRQHQHATPTTPTTPTPDAPLTNFATARGGDIVARGRQKDSAPADRAYAVNFSAAASSPASMSSACPSAAASSVETSSGARSGVSDGAGSGTSIGPGSGTSTGPGSGTSTGVGSGMRSGAGSVSSTTISAADGQYARHSSSEISPRVATSSSSGTSSPRRPAATACSARRTVSINSKTAERK